MVSLEQASKEQAFEERRRLQAEGQDVPEPEPAAARMPEQEPLPQLRVADAG
jgi:hypothetical protein